MNPPSGRKWVTWPRLVCLAVTVVILFLIFRQIGSAAFLAALQQMRPGWVLLGFLAYGLAIWLASLRWHLALRLTDRAIHLSASGRLFFIGHFFYVVLFGAAGGDLAKSVAYARYYQFRIPEVLAAVPLDRALGLAGNLVLACLVALIAVRNGGFENLESLNGYRPGVWLWVGALAVLLLGIGLMVWQPRGENFWGQTLRALRRGVRRLACMPGVAVPGTLFAFFSITALAGVFALNLQAVGQAALPWGRLLWTFPVITLVGCIPFTFAGAGVREAAALAFLGLYGVPPGECVAAALLTLVEKLLWGAVGAAVLWREEALRANHAGQPLPQTISVVIPTLNEAQALPETVHRARANPEVVEVIVVDGGSQDDTPRIAGQLGCRVLASAPGRGGQMRLGAAQAAGEVVILLHADTWLPSNAAHAALNCLRDGTVVGGGFWKVFQHTPLLLLGSRWKCALRLLLGRRILGDQAMFIRRETLEQIGGVPDQPLMEDFELSRRLRRVGRLALADATLITSARRFEELGVLRTYARMWYVTMRYRLGTPPHELHRRYDRH